MPIPSTSPSRPGQSLDEDKIRPGFSLPAHYYVSPDRYQADQEILRERSWWLAGHASQIPAAGDFFRFAFGNESIIVIRAKSGAINAFYNVCRHRGSRICLEDKGNAKRLTCPYHAWTYDTDGNLIGSPDMPSGFSKSDYGLKRCHIGFVDGLIFVCLARGDAPDFEQFANRFRPVLRPYRIEQTKVAAQDRIACAANWKLVVENFAECYHCGPSHKNLMRIHDMNSMSLHASDSQEAKAWREQVTRSGLEIHGFLDDPSTLHLQSAAFMKIGGEALSGGKSGLPMAPRLGDIKDWSGSWEVNAFNPMCQIGCYDDHILLFSFIPSGPKSTDCFLTWLVREDAVEGQDFQVDVLTDMWRHTILEDKIICANNQLGVESSAYQPGPYSTVESRTAQTVDWYVRHFVAPESGNSVGEQNP